MWPAGRAPGRQGRARRARWARRRRGGGGRREAERRPAGRLRSSPREKFLCGGCAARPPPHLLRRETSGQADQTHAARARAPPRQWPALRNPCPPQRKRDTHLLEAAEAGGLDGRLVHEDVLAAVVRRDKAEPLAAEELVRRRLASSTSNRTFVLLNHFTFPEILAIGRRRNTRRQAASVECAATTDPGWIIELFLVRGVFSVWDC